MMLFFPDPIPVVTPDGKDGYAIYVTNSGVFENDIFCVALCETGQLRHFNTSQLRIFANATINILKQQNT